MPNAKVYYAIQASKQALLCYTSKGDSLVELAGSQQRDMIIWQLVINSLKLYLATSNLYFAEITNWNSQRVNLHGSDRVP